MPRLAFRTLVLVSALSLPALAQRPVITRNADEPGRNPYQQHVFINQTAASCPNDFYCVVNFDAVPAGYRLVITYASARFSQQTAYVTARASLSVDGALFGMATILPGSVDSTTQKTLLSAGAVTFYVDGGHAPAILFFGYNVRSSYSSEASISGYLVPLP